MESRPIAQGFLIKLSRGEKTMAALTQFCEERHVTAGWLSALGAVKDAELGYYSMDERRYSFKKFAGDFEVASMTGNIALIEGKPFLHVHAVLSSCDDARSQASGHVKEAAVAVTLEVRMEVFERPVSRAYDEETGLKLLQVKGA